MKKAENLVEIGSVIGDGQPGKPVNLDVDRFRVTHALITAVSGAGKSYFVRVLMERMFGIAPLWIIDPEGEYASLRKDFDFILVGDKEDGADIPIRVDTAAKLATKLLALGASAIFDLSSLDSDQQQEWTKEFLLSLLHQKRAAWRALVLVIDEAHTLAPEKGAGESECTHEVVDACKRLRKRGAGVILSTQRITELNNGAAAQMQNYFIGRTIITADIERSAKALGIPKRKDVMEAFTYDAKHLKDGEFFALGPAVAIDQTRFKVPKSQTPHPEPGELREHKPPTPKAVKELLGSLGDLPKEVEAEAGEVEALRSEAETLRSEIVRLRDMQADMEQDKRTLEDQLAEAQENQRPVVVLPDFTGVREKLERHAQRMNDAEIERLFTAMQARFRALDEEVREEAEEIGRDLAEIERAATVEGGGGADTPAPTRRIEPAPVSSRRQRGSDGRGARDVTLYEGHPSLARTPRVVPTSRSRDVESSNGNLSSTASKMLDVLAAWYPKWMPKGMLAANLGIKSKTGSFSNRISELAVPGYVEKQGNALRASEAGVKATGKTFRAPRSTAEVRGHWEPKLSSTALNILDILIEKRGAGVPKQVLLDRLGLQDSGSFSNRLSELRTAGLLVNVEPGVYAANRENLFLGRAA